MSSNASWLVPAGATLASVVVTQAVALWASRIQRRDQRIERWEPQLMDLLYQVTLASDRLLALPVWPEDRTEKPEPARPLAEAVNEAATRYALTAPGSIPELATATAQQARTLAATIERIRRTTSRGTHGAVPEDARHERDSAATELAEALDRFTKAARRDLGIRTR